MHQVEKLIKKGGEKSILLIENIYISNLDTYNNFYNRNNLENI